MYDGFVNQEANGISDVFVNQEANGILDNYLHQEMHGIVFVTAVLVNDKGIVLSLTI